MMHYSQVTWHSDCEYPMIGLWEALLLLNLRQLPFSRAYFSSANHHRPLFWNRAVMSVLRNAGSLDEVPWGAAWSIAYFRMDTCVSQESTFA